MSEHTPEPWHTWDRGVGWEIHAGPVPSDGEHWWVAGERGHERSGECQVINNQNTEGDCFTEANARRIVACVNACAGIPTEILEKDGGASAYGAWAFGDLTDTIADQDARLAEAEALLREAVSTRTTVDLYDVCAKAKAFLEGGAT